MAGSRSATSSSAYVPISLTAVSCPTTTACVAVGGDTVARLTLIAPKAAPPPHRAGRRAQGTPSGPGHRIGLK